MTIKRVKNLIEILIIQQELPPFIPEPMSNFSIILYFRKKEVVCSKTKLLLLA